MKKDNFKKIIGYTSIKKELRVIADILKNPSKYEKLGANVPSGILIFGPPGTGKSTLAEAFLTECECPFYIIRKVSSEKDLIDEMVDTFEKAKESEGPCIILLDDFDKFSENRKISQNANAFVTLQSCIDNSKDSSILVVLTANNIENVPKSLFRRIDTIIKVKKPSQAEAKRIVGFYLKEKNCEDNIDVSTIVRVLGGANCATLENVINNATIIATRNKKNKIGMQEILKACLRVIYNAPEIEEGYSKKELHRLAVHEAGHAVIGAVLNGPGTVKLVALTRASGSKKGAVTIAENIEDENFILSTYESYEKRILRAMGGKAATDVVLSKFDMGISSDMRKCYRLVERLTYYYCVWGFDKFDPLSNKTTVRAEDFCSEKLEAYYNKAKTILINNRKFLDLLINELEEKIIVTGEQVDAIMEKVKEGY